MRGAKANAGLFLFLFATAAFAFAVFAVVSVLFAVVAAGAVFAVMLLFFAAAATLLFLFFVAAALAGSRSVMIWHYLILHSYSTYVSIIIPYYCHMSIIDCIKPAHVEAGFI